MNAEYAVETGGGRGAVTVVRIAADDPDALFDRLGLTPVAVRASAVRSLFGVDRALVARPDERSVMLMPHGGRAILGAVCDALDARGLRRGRPGGDASWPEAGDPVERRMLAALAVAPSPRAVGLLLDQPRRWRSRREGEGSADARSLGRLLRPPVVAAVGAPNIGKSSLLNALAGRSVALAFDRAGTTRDPVGVLIEVDGLVVRWVDTPGAAEAARSIAALEPVPDLVLRCHDAASDGPSGGELAGVPSLVVALRSDTAAARFRPDAATSATTGAGVTELGLLVRRTLVPDEALADPRPWRFWGDGDA